MSKDVEMDEEEEEDEVEVEVEVVVGIILGIAMVLKIKGTTQTTRSGITQKHDLKKGWNHKVNMLVRMLVISMV